MNEKIKHDSFGMISANIFSSSKKNRFFGDNSNYDKGISIEFATSEMKKDRIDINERFYERSRLFEVEMSLIQFNNLIMNTDSNLLTPVNILLKVDKNGERKNLNYLKIDNKEDHNLDKIKSEFRKKIIELYKDNKLKEMYSFLEQDKLSKQDKDFIKNEISNLVSKLKNNKEKTKEILLDSITELKKIQENDFVLDLKEHILSSIPKEHQLSAKMLLKNLNNHLIENKTENKDKKLDINESEGVMKISKISGDLNLINEPEAHNGVSIQLYQARVEFDIKGNKNIFEGELLCEYQLSMSQFADFVQNKNSSGKVCTVSYLQHKGKIESYPKQDRLLSYLQSLEELNENNVKKIVDLFSKDFKILESNSNSKDAKLELKNALDQLKYALTSNMEYFLGEYIKLQSKYSSDVMLDTIESMKKSKEKLAKDVINEMFEKNGVETIKQLINFNDIKSIDYDIK